MSVRKSVQIAATGPTIEEAVGEALDRASMTLEGITGFDLGSISGEMGTSGLVFNVELIVWFTLLERMHG